MKNSIQQNHASGDWHPERFVNLTVIRHRLAPPERLSAMEEARRIDDAERMEEWKRAILVTMAIALGVAAIAQVVLWLLRNLVK